MNESVKVALQVHRRESSYLDGSDTALLSALLVEHDEPETPIHPALEYEVFATVSDSASSGDDSTTVATAGQQERPSAAQKSVKLMISFIFLVIAGSGNAIAAKLQAIPMYNYPNFINIFDNFMYIPVCFAYIIPAVRYGRGAIITPDQINISRKPFAIMGALDCLATTMQVFGSVYLPGPLLVLLPQAAIPCSMFFSRYLLGQTYRWPQYLGAAVVLLGILVVLEPIVSHRRSPEYYCEALDLYNDCTVCQGESTQDGCLSHFASDGSLLWTLPQYERKDQTNPADGSSLCQWLPYEEAIKEEEFLTFVWSLVVLASTIPMTLSTIYKELALGDGIEIDPIYLNGWVSIFQFLFSLLVAIPAGWFSAPSIAPWNVPQNLWDGLECFSGHGSVDSGCHPDTMCAINAAFYVCLALGCNIVFTFFMMYVLKFGSSALLFLALTVMVPIGNLAFSLPFMPQATPLHVSDLMGLAVIMSGLIMYRFLDGRKEGIEDEPVPRPSSTTPWFQEMIEQLREPLIARDGQFREPLFLQSEDERQETTPGSNVNIEGEEQETAVRGDV